MVSPSNTEKVLKHESCSLPSVWVCFGWFSHLFSRCLRLAKFEKKGKGSKLGFRDQLKSTGKDKFALEEEDKVNIVWILLYLESKLQTQYYVQ